MNIMVYCAEHGYRPGHEFVTKEFIKNFGEFWERAYIDNYYTIEFSTDVMVVFGRINSAPKGLPAFLAILNTRSFRQVVVLDTIVDLFEFMTRFKALNDWFEKEPLFD